MKKSAALILSALIAATLMIPTQAADYKALTGTPTVDGKLDDIYTQSQAIETSTKSKKIWSSGNGADKSDADAKTYVLHDNDYIYFCTVVKESTIVECGIKSGWQSDAVELWIKFDGANKKKVSVDAFGTKIYGDIADTSKYKSAVTRADGQYITELAIPKADFKKEPVGISVQINDFQEAAATNGAAWGSQGAEDTITLSSDKVVVKKTETKKPDSAAKTADAGIIASIAAMAASAAVIFRKKH